MEDKEFNNLYNFSKKLVKILTISLNPVAKLLLEFKDSNNKSIKMLDLKKVKNEIVMSYLPVGKSPIYTATGKVSVKNRQTGKIGKTIKTFLKINTNSVFSDRDLELLVNELKSNNDSDVFSIVSGEDIKKFYYYRYASIRGSLGKSCMRYDRCQNYFKIYTDNPNCEMLVIRNKKNVNKIMGRALIWTVDGKKYMDRRYGASEVIEQKLVNYAIKNKWSYKQCNTYYDCFSLDFMVYENGEYISKKVKLKVKVNDDIKRFPYCDTLKYLYDGYIRNYDPEKGDFLKLNSTEGYAKKFTSYFCVCCGSREVEYQDNVIIINGNTYCCDCSVLDINGHYIIKSDAIRVVTINCLSMLFVSTSDLDKYTISFKYCEKIYYILKPQFPSSPLISSNLINPDDLHKYIKVNEEYLINTKFLN